MHRPRLSLLAASLLLASGIANATQALTTIPATAVKTAERLRDKTLRDDTGYRIVTSLTTEVGPRLAGSDADQRGRDWAIAKFKALGFDKVYTEPAKYPLWVRPGEDSEAVKNSNAVARASLGVRDKVRYGQIRGVW